MHMIQQIKKLSGVKEESKIPVAKPLNIQERQLHEEFLRVERMERSYSAPVIFHNGAQRSVTIHNGAQRSVIKSEHDQDRKRSGSVSSDSWGGSAFGGLRINSMPASPNLSPQMHSLKAVPPPPLERRTPSPPPRLPAHMAPLDSGVYETNDVKHNRRIMRQSNIVFPSPETRPDMEPKFATTLDIDWDLVNRQREKNDQLIGDFLQKRAQREILRSCGLRQDRRRTATSIPLDSVKPVPGATYFKTEGNQLKVDLDRGVKWSKSKCKWVAKTMYAGTKFTLGYFREKRLAEQAYLLAVDAKRNGRIKEHLLKVGARYTDSQGQVQTHQPQRKRGRGRPRKHQIKQGGTLWDKVMPAMRAANALGRNPNKPFEEIRPGVFVPQKEPRQEKKPSRWDAIDAAQILLRFRQQVQGSHTAPSSPVDAVIKPEKESTPVLNTPPLAPTAFKLHVMNEESSSDEEDDAMFGVSYGK